MVERQGQRTDATAQDSISLWDVHRFSYYLAFRSLSYPHLKDVARLLIEPCNYWRNVEVPVVVNHLRVRPGERILDVGSPKLPSLFVWYRLGAEVHATDLYPYFFEECSHYLRCLGGSPHGMNYFMEVQDARALGYPDAYFDKVYSISVIEHIEEQGDSQAMREISRVLKPGGLFCLTVPFAVQYRESTIDYELYYKHPLGGKPIFYERHYDNETLQTRLIRPSGMKVEALGFYQERWFPYERFYESLPRSFRIPFSLLGPAFSKLFLERVDATTTLRPITAYLALRKDGEKAIDRERKVETCAA